MQTKNQKSVLGVFDGENLKGEDGKSYPIPANYASKSKLVEGDRLKLTISDDGSFIFKQIAPIERKRLIATVKKEGRTFLASAGRESYRLLLAAVTYFQLKENDEIVIIVPRNGESRWAALENKVNP